MATGKMIYVDDLVSGLSEPGFPEMPGDKETIPFVPGARHMMGDVESEANVPMKLSGDIDE